MKIYRTRDGLLLGEKDRWRRAPGLSLDAIFRSDRPREEALARAEPDPGLAPDLTVVLAPIESQEVWAAGVTYRRSREARMEESEREADVYERVYDAVRPELFFKATPHRVVGHGEAVAIRDDSDWNVPEAELALAIGASGRVFGYMIGNDVSSRSIEGENPLYLPQAKIYDGSCALGPCLYIVDRPLPPETAVQLRVRRAGTLVFEGETRLSEMKRSVEELVEFLFRDCTFPAGVVLLTGTGIVPGADFTLLPEDEVAITIEPIGTLRNRVGRSSQGAPRA